MGKKRARKKEESPEGDLIEPITDVKVPVNILGTGTTLSVSNVYWILAVSTGTLVTASIITKIPWPRVKSDAPPPLFSKSDPKPLPPPPVEEVEQPDITPGVTLGFLRRGSF